MREDWLTNDWGLQIWKHAAVPTKVNGFLSDIVSEWQELFFLKQDLDVLWMTKWGQGVFLNKDTSQQNSLSSL